MIFIPDLFNRTGLYNLKNYIHRVCIDEGIQLSKDFEEIEVNLSDAYSPDKLCRLQEAAKAFKGKLLSSAYIGMSEKYTWMCSKKHVWMSLPNSVLQGSWCKECFWNRVKPSLSSFKEIAILNSGECLSKIYINCKTKLKFKCKDGHIWATLPSLIKRWHWCNKCYYSTVERDKLGRFVKRLNVTNE